jgi:hypothetical protein
VFFSELFVQNLFTNFVKSVVAFIIIAWWDVRLFLNELFVIIDVANAIIFIKKTYSWPN